MARAPLIVPLAALALGCGGSPQAPPSAPSGAGKGASSPVDRLLPFADGTVFAYDSYDEETGARGMFVTRVRVGASGRVELTTGARTKLLERLPDGVARVPERTYLLKAPLAVGATWRGEEGATVRVTAVDAIVEVPAGKFVGCVETVEERDGDARRRVTTVFCPDVGIVKLEVEASAGGEHALERAVLRSFGPAIDLGGPKQ